MSIDQRVVIGKTLVAAIIREKAAVVVIRAVHQPVEIIIVVRSLHDGIVDGRIRAVEPADKIRIFRSDLLRIDLRLIAGVVRGLRWFLLAAGGLRLARRRRRKAAHNIIIHMIRLAFFRVIRPDAVAAVEKNAKEDRKQNPDQNPERFG